MKSISGNVKVVATRYSRLIYGCVRKKYKRTHPYPTGTMRVNPLPREKAAVIKLRNLGYPTNMLAAALGRSTSFIHRILETALQRKSTRFVDMRKLPGTTRTLCSGIRWRNLQKYLSAWEAWIFGEGEKPP